MYLVFFVKVNHLIHLGMDWVHQ